MGLLLIKRLFLCILAIPFLGSLPAAAIYLLTLSWPFTQAFRFRFVSPTIYRLAQHGQHRPPRSRPETAFRVLRQQVARRGHPRGDEVPFARGHASQEAAQTQIRGLSEQTGNASAPETIQCIWCKYCSRFLCFDNTVLLLRLKLTS